MLNNWAILTTRDLQNVCSFQLTFRFHMLFFIFKEHIISIQQIEQFWCLETYKLFVPAQKQLAHPLFSSYSDCFIIKSQRTTNINVQFALPYSVIKIANQLCDYCYPITANHRRVRWCFISVITYYLLLIWTKNIEINWPGNVLGN